MSIRKDEAWLQDRVRRTGLGYTEGSKRVDPSLPRPPEKKEVKPKQAVTPAPKFETQTLPIKPLSVNAAWKGRRYRSDRYNAFKCSCEILLTGVDIDIPQGPLAVCYEFGFSNKGADWDNPVKPFQDVLQSVYGFNDSRIVEAYVSKQVVAPGEEYIKFKTMPAGMNKPLG